MTPIRIVREPPPGSRLLHEPVNATDKAVRFRYHNWIIWVPRSVLVLVGKEFAVPFWAVETAKKHPSAQHFRSEEEAFDRANDMRRGLSKLHVSPFVLDETK